MEIKGKKIAFLGDSITEGHGTSCEEATFVYKVGERGGFRASINYGIGGTRIARQQKIDLYDRFDLDFCMRCEELDQYSDIVMVFGGTNDYGHGDAPIGSPEDRDPGTFWGACHYLMNRLMERFQDKPVIIMTPLHRADELYRHKGVQLIDHVEIIRKVADYYHLPVLDLWNESGLDPKDEAIREAYVPDGLHPNDAGHEILAQKILAYLQAF